MNVATLLVTCFICTIWPSGQSVDFDFGRWKVAQKKSFSTAAEEKSCYQIYMQNVKRMQELNALHNGMATFGPNKFSGIPSNEFARLYLGANPSLELQAALDTAALSEARQRRDVADDDEHQISQDEGAGDGDGSINSASSGVLFDGTPPNYPGPISSLMSSPALSPGMLGTFGTFPSFTAASVDWTAAGYVTAVKNQGACGSCWSFCATGVTESHYLINKGAVPTLSEQELVDCTLNSRDASIKNYGCNGGWPANALTYIYKAIGDSTSTNYPYKGTANKKNCNPKTPKYGTLSKAYTQVPSTGKDVRNALRTVGPLCIVITGTDLQSYTGGILKCTTTSLNHAVLMTGYEITGNDPVTGEECGCYFVKNSWDTNWGENGYVRVGFGPCGGFPPNNCGVESSCLYPTMQ